MILYSNWNLVHSGIWRWPSFSPKEMACRHTGKLQLDEMFMDSLQALREVCHFPFEVSSGFRDASHPVEASKASGPGAHNLGKAVDIMLAHGGQKYDVITRAANFNFTGIGIEDGFVHLDTAKRGELSVTRPALWVY